LVTHQYSEDERELRERPRPEALERRSVFGDERTLVEPCERQRERQPSVLSCFTLGRAEGEA